MSKQSTQNVRETMEERVPSSTFQVLWEREKMGVFDNESPQGLISYLLQIK